jgi:quercetin dioxygenase-like cupin family protein
MSITPQNSVFQVGEDIPWVNAAPGIQRQVYGYDERIMLVKVKFEKGALGAVHKHYHVQVSYVESGEFEITIGDEKKTLNAGDGFHVPSDTLHGCLCLEAGVLIDVFSPHRGDFLLDS